MLKKVEAIIRAEKLYDVKDALHKAGIEFFSYSEVNGVGMATQSQVYRGHIYDMGTIDRIKIVIMISKNLKEVVQAIMDSGKTGELGDGRIMVTDMENVYNIRTGEEGAAALTKHTSK